MSRRPVVYHIINAGRRPMATASELVTEGKRVAVELAPEVVGTRGVFVEIDPRKLRKLDDEGWVFGYPERVDRRGAQPRRRRYQPHPPRGPGRRATDRGRRIS
jgi:hypothetical protein